MRDSTLASVSALTLALAPSAHAQEKNVLEQGQVWLGYMTQARVSDQFSLWNDLHLVPGGFYVLRTGLTYHLGEDVSATAGYAFLGLPVARVTPSLERTEHRPWGQLVYTSRFAGQWRFMHRVRYDARFRRNVVDGQLAPGFGFNHRIRFLFTFRRDLPSLTFGDRWVPYVSVGNEVLLNFGAGVVYDHLDQNRVNVGFGVGKRGLALQVGYMNRYVQLATGRDLVMNHTALLWVFHNFDLRSDSSGPKEPPVIDEVSE